MMRSTFRVFIVAAVCAVAPAAGAQGLLLVETTTIGGAPRTSQIQIEPTRMRTEVTGQDGSAQVLIFDGAKQVMHMVNPASKSYSTLTKADVDAAGAQMSGMMAKMQAAMKDMPPAQRAQMEAMMKGRGMPGAAGAAPPTEYRRTGTSKVSKWTCEVYEGVQNGTKTGEVCTVSPTALGFTAADFAVTRQLAEFMRGLIPQGADQLFQVGGAGQAGYPGVPVRRVTTVAGRQTVSEITSVERQTFPDSMFAVPAGFTQRASPLAGRGAPPAR
jgi:hypothetical protein